MSKRKAGDMQAPGLALQGSNKANGKQKAPELAHMDSQDLLSMALGGDTDGAGDLLPNAEDLDVNEDSLAEALGGEHVEFGLDEPSEVDDSILADDEIGDLPDGLEASQLEEQQSVDLTKYELTLPQARRVAQLLVANSSLTDICLPNHTLSMSDLEEDELEWDSEEYDDVAVVSTPAIAQRERW